MAELLIGYGIYKLMKDDKPSEPSVYRPNWSNYKNKAHCLAERQFRNEVKQSNCCVVCGNSDNKMVKRYSGLKCMECIEKPSRLSKRFLIFRSDSTSVLWHNLKDKDNYLDPLLETYKKIYDKDVSQYKKTMTEYDEALNAHKKLKEYNKKT